MGSFSSKIFPQVEEDVNSSVQTQMKMSAIEKNQMCTPVMSKKMSADPRSATVGIPRTPIEIVSTPPGNAKKIASAIPKHLRVKQYLETDVDLILPAMTPEKRIPDPRSPNVTLDRTPIMVKSTTGYISPIVMVQEGPDMLTPDGYDPRSPVTTFDRTPITRPKPSPPQTGPEDSTAQYSTTRMSFCETTGEFNLPEVQAVSTIPTITITTSKNLEERMKACDLDNLEDDVFHSDCGSSEESESENQITIIPNPKVLPDLQEAQSTEIDDKSSTEESKVTETSPKPQNNEDKGLIKVWRDSVSPVPPADLQTEGSSHSEEIMIEFDDETVVKSSKSDVKVNIEVEVKSKVQIINKHIKKVQMSGKEAKGVFEDVNVEAGKSRTPLGCRSNHKSRIPHKSPQGVLRAKGLSAKSGQQENTPPNTKRFRSRSRNNGGQWDPDMSVVI